MLKPNVVYLATVFIAFSHQFSYSMGYGVMAFNASYAMYNFLCFISIAYYFYTENKTVVIFRSKRLFILVLLFFVLTLLSSANSQQPLVSVASWLSHVSITFMGVSAFMFISTWPTKVTQLIIVILAAGFSVVFTEWFSIYENWSIYKHLKSGDIVQVVTFNHIRNMMHMVTAMWLISFYFHLKNIKGYRYFLLLIVQWVLLTVLVWAAGRIHLVLIPLAILMFSIAARRHNSALKLFISSWLMVFFAVIFLKVIGQDFMFGHLVGRMEFDFNNLSKLIDNIVSEEIAITEPVESSKELAGRLGANRGGLWLAGYELWQENPLFGHGADGYYLAGEQSKGTHPHNWIILFLVQYGVVGLALFSTMLTLAFKTAITNYIDKHNDLATLVIVYNVIFLSYGLLSGCFYYALPLMYFVVVNAIFLGCYCNDKLSRGSGAI
jgi:O-antigen ligase